jgi:hypothetical protein
MNATPLASTIILALETAYTAIQQFRPQIRPAIFVIHREKAKTQRGHYHQDQWQHRDDEARTDEIYISSTILNEGPTSVFHTLLHEATHSLAVARHIEDTSRNGRYHNRKFASLATEMGLIVTEDFSIGTRTTGITPLTQDQYKAPLLILATALRAYQNMQQRNKQPTRMLKATCQCGRIIRASLKVMEGAAITCEECGTSFTTEGI